MTDKPSALDTLELAKEVVAAHVANNRVPLTDLPRLISDVYRTLSALGAEGEEAERPRPAVPARRSIYPDYLICLEDGKKLKMLKRHLKTAYNMSPDEYRERWNLPPDYPMVAPNYAHHRSELAKQIGLGRRRDTDGDDGAGDVPSPSTRGSEPAGGDNPGTAAHSDQD